MVATVTYSMLPLGPTLVANTYPYSDEDTPDVVGLSNGATVLTYNAIGYALVDFYDADHNPIGLYRLANVDNTAIVGQPRVTELANGNVLVAWDDDYNGTNAAGLKGRIFDNGGNAVSGELSLSDNGFQGYTSPAVTALTNGDFVVTYGPASSAGIASRIYDASGALVAGPITVDTGASDSDSQVVALSGGGYVTAWTDSSGAASAIRCRIFDGSGTPTGAAFTIDGTGNNDHAELAALKNGGFAVVYADTGWSNESGSYGISLQLFDAAGNDQTPGFVIQVNGPTPSLNELDPDVTVLANGFVVVTWTDPYNATDSDIHARIFDPSGASITVDGQTELTIPGAGTNAVDTASAVDALLDGRFVTAWQQANGDGDGDGIRMQESEVIRTVQGDNDDDSYVGDGLRDHMFGGGGADTLSGGDGADTLEGGFDHDTLAGGAGDDVLYGMTSADPAASSSGDLLDGGDGDDALTGSGDQDTVAGGAGADTLQGGAFSDILSGGDGNDRIYGYISAAPGASVDGDTADGGAGNDTVVGSAGDDVLGGGVDADNLFGGAGADTMDGGSGADKMNGSSGDDVMQGGYDNDTVNGGVGDDVLYAMTSGDVNLSLVGDLLIGYNGADTIYGSGGADDIRGGAQNDSLVGGDGGDTINGNGGKDRLAGGHGADTLTGGADKDTFVFSAVTDSDPLAPDRITDLGNFDRIDLSGIDANSAKTGDQKFHLVTAYSHSAGELLVHYNATGDHAGSTSIEGDVNGDGVSDFLILADGDRHRFDNFVL